jgi:thiamine biosynthesis lipoprotein
MQLNNACRVMRLNYNKLILSLLLLSLVACQPRQRVVETKDTILAFGTLVEVTLINVPDKDKQAVLKLIHDDLDHMHFVFHAWHPGPLGRTNELLAQTAEFTANPSVIPLLHKAQTLARQSHDLFNPAIGKLLKLWGFEADLPPAGPPPPAAAIQALLQLHPSMADMTIKGIRISNTNPAVKLDLGAIAKGYALDIVTKHLKAIGIDNATINAGGGIKVLGQHGDRPWHIGIRDPRSSGVIASVDLRDGESISTSGDYERFYDYQGKRYCHILDPRTGYPVDTTRSVTVIDKDGTLADAASTALFVAGPRQWLAIAKDMGVTQAMLIDQHGVMYLTPQMQQRIKLEEPVKDVKVVSLP